MGAPVTTGEHAGVTVSDEAAKMGGQVDTYDLISVVARTYIQPNDFSST